MRCRGGRDGVVGGEYFSRSGDFNIWSLLDWACHVHSVPWFSIVASHNCGGRGKKNKEKEKKRDKNQRRQRLQQHKQMSAATETLN